MVPWYAKKHDDRERDAGIAVPDSLQAEPERYESKHKNGDPECDQA
jgi:hypothetical protein